MNHKKSLNSNSVLHTHHTAHTTCTQCPDTPPEDFDRSNSRLSTDSLELKLSTTFILRVTRGGSGEEAGLEVGHMVHMINGVKIISSSVQEIQRTVGQWWVTMEPYMVSVYQAWCQPL